jgi:hypothetical protein
MNEINGGDDASSIDRITDDLLTRDKSNKKYPQSWSRLNETIIRICWGILLKDSMAHACRTVKNNYLFKAPFQLFNQNGKELHMTPSFAEYFEKYYKQFGRDFLDAVMVLGVVPFSLVQQENGHRYPSIPAPNTYAIQMTYVAETERRYYRVWRPKSYSINFSKTKQIGMFSSSTNAPNMVGGRAFSGLGGNFSEDLSRQLAGNSMSCTDTNWYVDENIYVIDGLGYDPGVDGTVNSPLSAIIADMVFTNSLADRMLQAEEQMTNPIFMMQHHKNVDADTDIDPNVVHNLPVFDSDELSLQAQRSLEMVQEQKVALQKQFALIRKIERKMATGEFGQGDADMREKLLVAPRVISVPKGMEYVRGDGIERHAGNKFMHQQDLMADAIARVFGIPLTMLKNVGTLRGFQEAHRENFRNQIGEDANLLGTHMTCIFNEIYGHNTQLLDLGLVRCKEVIDDTYFTRLPRGYGSNQETKIDVQTSKPLAPVDSKIQMFEETTTTSSTSDTKEELITEKDKAQSVKEMKKRNAEYRKSIVEKGPEGSSRIRNMTNSYDISYVITIPVAIHAEAKVAKHAWDVGAIDLETYQSILRSKVGLGRMPFKPNPDFVEDVVNTTIRATGSEPPRVDSQKPEGEDLGTTSKKFEQERQPGPGMLTEAVRKRKLTVKEVQETVNPPKSGDKEKKKPTTPSAPKKRKVEKDKEKDKSKDKSKVDRSE